MRVAFVTTSFPLAPGASSGVFVERLARHLAAHPAIDELVVLVPAGEDDRPPPTGTPYRLHPVRYAPRRWQRLAHRPGGLPVALARRDPALLLLPALAGTLLAATVREARRVDLLHGHWAIGGTVAGAAARLARRPAVTTLRGADVERAGRSPADRLLLAACLRTSRRIATVSPEMHRRVLRLAGPRGSRVAFTPNGVDLAAVRPVPRAAGEALRVLAVGSLVPRKAMDTVVRAVALLPGGVRLTLVGDGPERGALEALAQELGIRNRVDFAGQVPPDAVPDLLAAADAFVLASRSEGRSNALLEAMAAGLPVVASDIDGTRALVTSGREGLLFPVGDSGDLAAHLAALQRDPGLAAALGAAARSRVEAAGLTWSAAAARYVEIYRAALAEAGLRATTT